MCIALEKLEELTPKLPHIPSLSDFKHVNDSVTTYEFNNGVAISENVYSIADIAIAKTLIPKGTNFDTHQHNISAEWVIVLDGLLNVTIETESVLLNKYDSIKIDAAKPHSAIAVKDTTIIAITVPRDEGHPE